MGSPLGILKSMSIRLNYAPCGAESGVTARPAAFVTRLRGRSRGGCMSRLPWREQGCGLRGHAAQAQDAAPRGGGGGVEEIAILLGSIPATKKVQTIFEEAQKIGKAVEEIGLAWHGTPQSWQEGGQQASAAQLGARETGSREATCGGSRIRQESARRADAGCQAPSPQERSGRERWGGAESGEDGQTVGGQEAEIAFRVLAARMDL